VESAGNPSNFNLSGGILLGVPIVTLPIKVHLGNPLLGSTCYIGSDAGPILLHPENTDISATSLAISRFDADGTPDPTGELSLLSLSGAVQGDSTFSVPGASGCGTLGVLNSAINSKEGLPSASGNNNIVLNGGKTLQAGLINPGAFVPNAGQRLSADWHAGAAAAPTPCAGACPTATPTATPTAVPVVLPPAPTLGNITSDGTTTTVSGTLAAAPSTAYTLTFYSGASCDGLGTGTALGSSEITTDATGAATFAAVLDGFVPAGQSVAATSAAAGVISNSSACARVAARACTGDSDCDGYSDAQEIAAGANAFNYCPIMRADVDGDGGVHLLDLARAASVYGEAVPPAPSRYNQGPAPFDSAINLLDLSKMAAKYNESVGQCP
jgi:hypothetical protein